MDGFAEPVETVEKEERQEDARRAYVSFEDGVGKDFGTFAMNVVCMSGEKDEHGHYVVVPYDVTSPAHVAANRAAAFIDSGHERKVDEAALAKIRGLVELGQKLGVVSPSEAEKFAIEEGTAPQMGHA